MPEVPKIVRERLRRAAMSHPSTPKSGVQGTPVPAPHPDADLLAAFAEQGLLPAERAQVIEHLAACEDCRVAVMVALPPVQSVAVPQVAAETVAAAVSRSAKRGWFSRPVLAWPMLRWGALAAGVVVAGAMLLHYSGTSNQAPISRQTASEAKSEHSAAPVTAPPLAASATVETDSLSVERDKTLAGRKSAAIAANSEPQVLASNRRVVKAKDAETRFANKKVASPAARGAMVAGREGGAPGAPTSSVPASHETAEGSGAVVQTPESAAVPGNQVFSARNQMPLSGRNVATLSETNQAAAPITKAKAATPAEQAAPKQLAKAVPQPQREDTPLDRTMGSAQWSISGGMLRRSLDGGTTWQTALPDGRLLSYSVRGTDVWTGGKLGVLFHSADGGTTWTQVHPSVGDRSLSNDITKMEVSTPAEIVLSTRNGEIWTSVDDGKTWARK